MSSILGTWKQTAALGALLAMITCATSTIGLAASPGNLALQTLDNGAPSVVATVLADDLFQQTINEKEARLSALSLTSGLQEEGWKFYFLFDAGTETLADLHFQKGYTDNANSNTTNVAAFFSDLKGTLFQLQSPKEAALGFLLAGTFDANVFEGEPDATDKISTRWVSLVSYRSGPWTPALIPAFEYIHKGSNQTKPDLKFQLEYKTGEFAVTPFYDRALDRKHLPATTTPLNDSNAQKWSVGAKGQYPAVLSASTWNLIAAAAYLQTSARGAAQTNHGYQQTATFVTPAFHDLTGKLSFEYDHNTYDALEARASSSKRIWKLQLIRSLPARSLGAMDLMLEINQTTQGVTNQTTARNLNAFQANGILVEFRIHDAGYRSIPTLRMKEIR